MDASSTDKKRTRQSRSTKFPLPDARVNLEKHILVLKTLNTVSNKGNSVISSEELEPQTGINRSMISGAIGFLFKIGFLNRDNYKYSPKKEVIQFCDSLDWDKDAALQHFRELILKTWFGEFIEQQFKINKEISKEDLIKKLGLYSGADNKYHGSAIKLLLDFLIYSEIIKYSKETNNFTYFQIQESNLNTAQEIDSKYNSSQNNSPDNSSDEKFDTDLDIEDDSYVIHIRGPDTDSKIIINEEDDLLILSAYIKKIEKKLLKKNE